MRKLHFNLNVREKLLTVVVLGFLIAFSLVGIYRISQAKLSLYAEMNHSGQERALLIAESVSNLIAAYDYSNIESLAQRILKFQDVKKITIFSRSGKVMVEKHSTDIDTQKLIKIFEAPVIFADDTIGRVQLEITMDRLQAEIYKTYRNIVVVITAFATFLGALIYFSVSILIIKPLSRLSKAVDQLSMGDFNAVLPAESSDELGQMVRAFSTMRENRKKVELELNDLNASLETIVMARIAELRNSEAYTNAVLENVNEGIIVIDEKGTITTFNSTAEKIFGYSSEEVIQQNFSMLISTDELDITGKFHRYNETQNHASFYGINREVIGIRKDYSAFPLELKTSQLHIQDSLTFITTARDISERKESEQRIRYMASHDALTKLPNRALLQDRIQQTLKQNQRRNFKAAILFIDLDKFKNINDTLGHDVGDGLLKEAASRLLATVRNEDTVARQGGDEFIILLSNIKNPADAGIIAQKVLDAMSQAFVINGNELHISASVGITIYPDDGNDMETLLKNSDIAMYHTKESGRNNYHYFSEKMNKQAAEKQLLSTELRHAVERKQLSLVYQPVVDTLSDEMTGMEVLLRWHHPELGHISPVVFIPLAEESGAILPIGEWVFKTACRQMRDWQNQGYDVPRLAINLSAKQFYQKNLIDNLSLILEQTGINANNIGIEITESMLVQDIDEVVNTLLKLSNMGVEISIDDFGTGYSSLSYLKRFPIDKLKIDKSFVDDITTHPDDAAIVKAIIAMAHGLSMKVVSEGVETTEQLDFLRKYGCEQYQGYLFSKPLPAAMIEAQLQRSLATG
jgi:diguanylate cyclase (GGDEF)-like protein/PAS domain S-box-containing protein